MNTNIYIDAANILLSAENIGFKLDLNKLFIHLKDKYKNCRIIFFIGNIKALTILQEILTQNDVEVCIKQVAREGGKLKANCDVDLTNRVTIDVERDLVDMAVIMTGDGDFAVLFDYIKDMQKYSRCISMSRANTSIFIRRRQYLSTVFLEDLVFLKSEKGFDRDLPL